MKTEKIISINQITQYLKQLDTDAEIFGNMDTEISGFSSFYNYRENTITWIKNIQCYKKDVKAGKEITPALIVIDREVDQITSYYNKVVCSNPKYVFALILREFFEEKSVIGTGRGSIISRNAYLYENVSVGCNCIIEDDVIIGSGTKIYHNVVIRKGTVIGRNCIIKSGTIIGEEGYGYTHYRDEMIHLPHLGYVELGDEVEIGSNCSIDRGTMENTIVGKGSKIDNLCHIAHNVQIGRDVMIVAGVIICGSVQIKDGAYIAPGGIVRNQVTIGKNCIIGMGSVVLKDTQQEKVLAGVPARNLRDVKNEEL